MCLVVGFSVPLLRSGAVHFGLGGVSPHEVDDRSHGTRHWCIAVDASRGVDRTAECRQLYGFRAVGKEVLTKTYLLMIRTRYQCERRGIGPPLFTALRADIKEKPQPALNSEWLTREGSTEFSNPSNSLAFTGTGKQNVRVGVNVDIANGSVKVVSDVAASCVGASADADGANTVAGSPVGDLAVGYGPGDFAPGLRRWKSAGCPGGAS